MGRIKHAICQLEGISNFEGNSTTPTYLTSWSNASRTSCLENSEFFYLVSAVVPSDTEVKIEKAFEEAQDLHHLHLATFKRGLKFHPHRAVGLQRFLLFAVLIPIGLPTFLFFAVLMQGFRSFVFCRPHPDRAAMPGFSVSQKAMGAPLNAPCREEKGVRVSRALASPIHLTSWLRP